MSKPIPFTGYGHEETMLYYRLKIERMELERKEVLDEAPWPARVEPPKAAAAKTPSE